MKIDFFKRLGMLLIFLLAQVIVLGRIHLFGVATPLLYVYFLLQMPYRHAKWAVLLWGFLMGLTIDIFFNTPGVAAASMTFIAALQPYYLEFFVAKGTAEGMKPSLKTLGTQKYIYYSIPLVLLFCLTFFTLELFSFFQLTHWLLCIGGSAALTFILIISLEAAKKR